MIIRVRIRVRVRVKKAKGNTKDRPRLLWQSLPNGSK
jgi:hypothetical protein